MPTMSVSEAWTCCRLAPQLAKAGFLTRQCVSFGNYMQTLVSLCIFLSRGSTAFIKFPEEAMYLLWFVCPIPLPTSGSRPTGVARTSGWVHPIADPCHDDWSRDEHVMYPR